MTFIERLRQQLEAQSLAQQQREREIEAARKAESLAQEQRFDQERALHEQRKRQTKAFREESGVGVLVAELGRVLVDQRITMPPYHQYQFPEVISKGFSMGPDYSIFERSSSYNNHVFPTTYPITYLPTSFYYWQNPYSSVYPDIQVNTDSAVEVDNDNGSKHQIKRRIPIEDADGTLDIAIWDRERESKGVGEITLEAKQKFLAVETCSNGNIVFHAWEKTLIPLSEWRTNKNTLDKALERAFNRPGIHRFMRETNQEPGE